MNPFLSFLIGVWLGEEQKKNSDENSYKTSTPNISEKTQEYPKKQPKETQRPIGRLYTNVFADEGKKTNHRDVWDPSIHYHNDPREYSRRGPRRHCETPGKLYKNVFKEDYEKNNGEKVLTLKKNEK